MRDTLHALVMEMPRLAAPDHGLADVQMRKPPSPTLDFRTKSGGTTSSGGTTGIGPGETYEWRGSFFPVDPNTGVAWTASGLNAATSGMKIAS